MNIELISNIIKALKNLGIFIGGIGAFSAARSFKQYRLKERSEVAAKALIILNNCMNKIIDIAKYPGLYENHGYDPDNKSEIPLKNNERDWKRPFILLSDEKYKLKKEFQEAIVKISGKEFSTLHKMLDRIIQLISNLINFLPQKTSDRDSRNRMILKHKQQLQAWINEISEIRNGTEDILLPIINGISWWSKVHKTIVFLLNNLVNKFQI